jgi:rare lipoprotein A
MQAATVRLARSAACAAACAGALWLTGCGTAPVGGGPRPAAAQDPERDGPPTNPPPDLLQVPDAEPRIEPIRSGGPNKPYEVLGQQYVPITVDQPFRQRGLASWYGRKFHGKRTATGEPYDMYAMTAAHPTLPLPSYLRVRNLANGREVIVRVNDRGPFHSERILDLSYTAALKLDLLRGVRMVEIERITGDEIRSGLWRRGATPAVASVPAAPPADTPSPETPVATPAEAAPAAASPRGFWVQLGAFQQRDGALGFQQRVAQELDWLAPLLAIVQDRSLHRLQAGPYASRSEAGGAAERIRAALKLVPVIVERR